jgi:hypothetical protein
METKTIVHWLYWLALASAIGCGVGAYMKYKSDIYTDSTTEAACQEHTTSTTAGAACGAWVQSKGPCLKGQILASGGCLHKDTTFLGLFLASTVSLLVWWMLVTYNTFFGSKWSTFWFGLGYLPITCLIVFMVYTSIALLK